jgi:tellurite resistance protein TehA-like permease
LGRGSFAIVDLGIIAKKAQILSATNAQIWYSITLFLGLLIWSWALIWILIAFTGLFTTLRKGRLPFNLGWWAFTFPLGTFGLASGVLSGQLDSTFFRVVATVVTITVVGFWILVSVKSILLLVGDGKRFMQVSLGLQQVDVPQKDKVEGKKDFGLEKRLSESPTRSNSSNSEA